MDDVINVSGHRIGTAEVESKLDEHPMCAEAAVVGYPHRSLFVEKKVLLVSSMSTPCVLRCANACPHRCVECVLI